MKKQIAILFDENNKISDVFNAVKISVYEKKENWQEVYDFEINIKENNVRTGINEIIIRLKDTCKIIIGSEVIGVAYYIFEKGHFIVCEADDFSNILLDQVFEDFCIDKEENDDTESIKQDIPKQPYPLDNEGNYFLDYSLIAKNYPEISSKKALLPFLSNELYQSLTIVCSHIMPWIETFVDQRDLKMEHQRENGLYTVKISHKVCSNGEEE